MGQYQYHPILASIGQYPIPQYQYRSNPSEWNTINDLYRNLILTFRLVLQDRSSVAVVAGKKRVRGFQSFQKTRTGSADVLHEMSWSFEDVAKSRSFVNVNLEDRLILTTVGGFQMTDHLSGIMKTQCIRHSGFHLLHFTQKF